jgi:L-ascorbate metabolism protein UlaG (beta-lactamase superfamily)
VPDNPAVPSDPRLTFLGHSSVLIELEGARVLTDPVLRDGVTVLRRVTAPLAPATYAGIDVALISHLHLDHFDLPSLRLLGPGVQLVVPFGAARLLRRSGFATVRELAPGDSLRVGDLSITATPAAHGGYRPPLGPRAEAVGYLLEGRARRLYFAGDTDLFPGMGELGRDLDVALLPVWGWGPTLGPGHLDPGRAAAAMRLMDARFAVPIHWGTLWPRGLGAIGAGRLSRPPREFADRAAVHHPDGRVLLTEPGHRVAFPA